MIRIRQQIPQSGQLAIASAGSVAVSGIILVICYNFLFRRSLIDVQKELLAANENKNKAVLDDLDTLRNVQVGENEALRELAMQLEDKGRRTDEALMAKLGALEAALAREKALGNEKEALVNEALGNVAIAQGHQRDALENLNGRTAHLVDDLQNDKHQLARLAAGVQAVEGSHRQALRNLDGAIATVNAQGVQDRQGLEAVKQSTDSRLRQVERALQQAANKTDLVEDRTDQLERDQGAARTALAQSVTALEGLEGRMRHVEADAIAAASGLLQTNADLLQVQRGTEAALTAHTDGNRDSFARHARTTRLLADDLAAFKGSTEASFAAAAARQRELAEELKGVDEWYEELGERLAANNEATEERVVQLDAARKRQEARLDLVDTDVSQNRQGILDLVDTVKLAAEVNDRRRLEDLQGQREAFQKLGMNIEDTRRDLDSSVKQVRMDMRDGFNNVDKTLEQHKVAGELTAKRVDRLKADGDALQQRTDTFRMDLVKLATDLDVTAETAARDNSTLRSLVYGERADKQLAVLQIKDRLEAEGEERKVLRERLDKEIAELGNRTDDLETGQDSLKRDLTGMRGDVENILDQDRHKVAEHLTRLRADIDGNRDDIASVQHSLSLAIKGVGGLEETMEETQDWMNRIEGRVKRDFDRLDADLDDLETDLVRQVRASESRSLDNLARLEADQDKEKALVRDELASLGHQVTTSRNDTEAAFSALRQDIDDRQVKTEKEAAAIKEAVNERFDDATRDRQRLASAITDLSKEQEATKRAIEASIVQVGQRLTHSVADLQKDARELVGSLQTLRNNHQAHQLSLVNLEKDLDDAKNKSTRDAKEVAVKIADLARSRDDLQQAIDAVSVDTEKVGKLLEQAITRQDTLFETLDAASRSNKQSCDALATRTRQDLITLRTSLAETLNDVRSQLNKEQAVINTNVDELSQRVSDLDGTVASQTVMLNDAASNRRRLQVDMEALGQRVSEHAGNIAHSTGRLDQAEMRLNQHDANFSQVGRDMHAIDQNQTHKSTQLAADLSSHHHALSTRLDQTATAVADAKRSIVTLSEVTSQAVSIAHRTENRIHQVNAEITEMTKSYMRKVQHDADRLAATYNAPLRNSMNTAPSFNTNTAPFTNTAPNGREFYVNENQLDFSKRTNNNY